MLLHRFYYTFRVTCHSHENRDCSWGEGYSAFSLKMALAIQKWSTTDYRRHSGCAVSLWYHS